LPNDEGVITAKITLDITTENGALIGFADDDDSRALVGYEPAASVQGFVVYTSTTGFSVLNPVAELTNGDYYIRASKIGTQFRFEVATDPLFRDVIGLKQGSYPDLTSSKLRLNIKAPDTAKLISQVQYCEYATGLNNSSKKLISVGRELLITNFGGAGNDYCFVRTPDNYTNDGAAHPMVILNHGNGWTMNGTAATANFSSKTQFGVDATNAGTYLDTGRSDYELYSSPLIEALLSAGYVVCGAQNNADSLYGNPDCRNAAVDFYQWMLHNFNVRQRCHMIGASNGCMTTLNASALLGAAKIASMALLYPLCDLIDHYIGYTGHRSAIEAAYGLAGMPYDKAGLLAEPKLFSHCPVNHFVIGATDSTTQKTAQFPPIKIIASGGDSVTAAVNNAEKLKALCDRSSMICDYTDIDPGGLLSYNHGDFHHFKESEIVSFFDGNK
jgi:hypothetical protein